MEEIIKYRNSLSKILRSIISIETKTATFYLIENNGIVSVVSDYFDFPTMKEEIKYWFQDFDKFLIVARCFDGDFLELSLFKDKDYLTCYVTGDMTNYDLTQSEFDAKIISNVFNVTQQEIEQAYNDIPEIALDNFSRLFKLPLKLQVLDLINSQKSNINETTYYL